MPFAARHVMNSLLERSFKEGRNDISPMKAQKLLFYTHGWHLAITGEPAIDQPFEVWRYGPVVGQIYHGLKGFGSEKITKYLTEFDFTTQRETAYVVNKERTHLYDALDIAWEKYVGISATSLSAMTHEEGSPWAIAKTQGIATIPNDYIREYFVGLTKQ
jgi:uncharacterized phage-associated protein